MASNPSIGLGLSTLLAREGQGVVGGGPAEARVKWGQVQRRADRGALKPVQRLHLGEHRQESAPPGEYLAMSVAAGAALAHR